MSMCQINPQHALDNGWITPSNVGPDGGTRVQQNGIDLTVREDVVIKSKSFKNVALAEKISVPKHVLATMYARSSYNRAGLTMTAGVYDSCFCGQCGVNITNMSDVDITIPKGTRVCQVVFWKGDCASEYNGVYKGQTDVTTKLALSECGTKYVETNQQQSIT